MFRAFQMHGIDPEEFYRKSPADRAVIGAFIAIELKMARKEWAEEWIPGKSG